MTTLDTQQNRSETRQPGVSERVRRTLEWAAEVAEDPTRLEQAPAKPSKAEWTAVPAAALREHLGEVARATAHVVVHPGPERARADCCRHQVRSVEPESVDFQRIDDCLGSGCQNRVRVAVGAHTGVR